MTQTTPQRNNPDPTIQAARITRTAQIVTAVIAAVSAATAAAIPAYLAGRDKGDTKKESIQENSPRVTVTATTVATVTVTATNAGGPEQSAQPTAPSNSKSLFDLPPLRGESDYEISEALVNTRSYDQVLLGGVHCQGQSVVYQLDRKYKQFTSTVGLKDESLNIPVRFSVYVDDKLVKPGVVVGLGKTKEVKVPVDGAFRMELWVKDADNKYCPAFEESQLWAAWIAPTLHP